MDEEEKREIRREALSMALECTAYATADDMLKTAKKFEAYLLGD